MSINLGKNPQDTVIELDEIIRGLNDKVPMIICGEFNAPHNSSVINTFKPEEGYKLCKWPG